MSLEAFIISLFESIANIDFNIVIQLLLVGVLVYWFAVAGWVFLDARDRSTSRGFIFLSTLFVLVFNIPGLLVYLFIRPKLTLSEQYWNDLEKRYLLNETAYLFDCPKCSFPLAPGYNHCPSCNETIRVTCECGKQIDKYWRHCPFCGLKNSLRPEDREVAQDISEAKKFTSDIQTKENNSLMEKFNKFRADILAKLEERKKVREQKALERKAQREIEKAKKLEEQKLKDAQKAKAVKGNKEDKKKKKNKNKKK